MAWYHHIYLIIIKHLTNPYLLDKFFKFIYKMLSSFLLVLFLCWFIFIESIFCSPKGFESLLIEVSYKNADFMVSKGIKEIQYKAALDYFLYNKLYINPNINIVKYHQTLNNYFVPFNYKSCYSHFNAYFGYAENLYFNLQLSHKKVNNNFEIFTTKDILNDSKNQYLCKKLYLYNGFFNQHFLNKFNPNLNFLNNYYKCDLENSKIIQSYIDLNKKNLNNAILNAFNIK